MVSRWKKLFMGLGKLLEAPPSKMRPAREIDADVRREEARRALEGDMARLRGDMERAIDQYPRRGM